MRFARLIPAVFAVLALASPVAAQDEKPKGHPRFSAMPSYDVANADEQEFGAAEFELGGGQPQKHVEGKYWKIDYAVRPEARRRPVRCRSAATTPTCSSPRAARRSSRRSTRAAARRRGRCRSATARRSGSRST